MYLCTTYDTYDTWVHFKFIERMFESIFKCWFVSMFVTLFGKTFVSTLHTWGSVRPWFFYTLLASVMQLSTSSSSPSFSFASFSFSYFSPSSSSPSGLYPFPGRRSVKQVKNHIKIMVLKNLVDPRRTYMRMKPINERTNIKAESLSKKIELALTDNNPWYTIIEFHCSI